MNTYSIEIREKADFEGVGYLSVNHCEWDYDFKPETYARIIFVPDDGFYAELKTSEREPLARFTENYMPMCKDSCMEMFFDFAPEKGLGYMNFEMNPNGRILCNLGTGRRDRRHVTDFGDTLPEIKANISEYGWELRVHIKLTALEKIYGKLDIKKGYKFRGNIYKCGDDTPKPHYLTWNPVLTPQPDYHRPEFFGEFELI